MRYLLVTTALHFLVANGSLAAASPSIVLTGAPSFSGEFAGFDGDTLRFTTPEGETREIAADSFVRWSHPREPVRRPRVLLADGSELVADLSWTTDGSVQLAGEKMQVRTSLLGRVPLPRHAVRGVLFDAARDPLVAIRVLREMRASKESKDDQVWLVNGDRLSGNITKIDGAVATLQVSDQSINVPLSNLSAVAFRQPETASAEPARWAFGLQDGSLLRVATMSGDDQNLPAKLAAGINVKIKSLRDVVYVQNLAGNFAYLSDMTPLDYRHTPYFNLAWPLAVNENLRGEPLRTGGQRYLKGLAVHSASRVVYRLTGDERLFESTIALDDTAGRDGSVIFQIYVVRNGKPELAYESDILRGGEESQDISVDVAGAQGLVLLVDYADYGDQQDHANWLDARLVR